MEVQFHVGDLLIATLPNGGDCGVWAGALLLCLVVIPAIITAVFVWRVG